MVRRSLEAANAIIAGNSVSLRASATMIMSWGERLLECVLDEGRTELRAQPLHDRDDRDRDAGSDETILDGGRTRHVLHEALHEIDHFLPPRFTTESGGRYCPADPEPGRTLAGLTLQRG